MLRQKHISDKILDILEEKILFEPPDISYKELPKLLNSAKILDVRVEKNFIPCDQDILILAIEKDGKKYIIALEPTSYVCSKTKFHIYLLK